MGVLHLAATPTGDTFSCPLVSGLSSHVVDYGNQCILPNGFDAIHAGAGGYIFLKDMTPESLIQSVHRVVEGGTQMTTALLHTAVENLLQNGRRTLAERTTEAARLTEREVDVLRLMGNGDSNKTISEVFGITIDTVKKHVRNIIDKLQARSRIHASIIAAQAGIIGVPISVHDLPE